MAWPKASVGSRRLCISARTAGGAPAPNTRWLTEEGARRPIVPGHYFRICLDATLSIATLTVSDGDQRSNWASRYRKLAPGGRRVTAGDGNMVRVGHMGHPRHAPHGAPGNTRTARIAKWSRRRGQTHVRTYTRG